MSITLDEISENITQFQCPVCDGEPMILGFLGSKLWIRCRNCGITYSKKEE